MNKDHYDIFKIFLLVIIKNKTHVVTNNFFFMKKFRLLKEKGQSERLNENKKLNLIS